MRIAILAILITLLASPSFAQGRVQNIEIDEIETINLGDEGRRVVRFRTEHVGRLRADLFSNPESTGAIEFTFRVAGSGDDADPLPPVVEPGRYEAIIQAVNPGAAQIQVNIWLDIPLDAFEPNDSQDEAVAIDVPFDRIIQLTNSEPDWFRVETRRGGILGVHLYTGSQFDGARIEVLDHRGEQVFLSDNNMWGNEGMRYVRTTGRPMYIHVWDTNAWGESDARAFKTLMVRQYYPEGDPSSDNPLVVLSLPDDSSASFQLDLVGAAIGVDTVDADEADAVANELQAAIEGRSGSNWNWLLILLGLVLVGGGGFFGWRIYNQQKGAAG